MSTEINIKPKPVELSKPEKLNDLHDLTQFDCGESSINDFLTKHALKAQEQKLSVVYVSCFAGTNIVAGYYTLASGSICRASVAPKRLQRNTPNSHPVTILGRMGVTLAAQKQGFAAALLKDAIQRCIIASQVIATSAVIVHPLTDELANFYARKAGFLRCPELSPLTMMLSLR